MKRNSTPAIWILGLILTSACSGYGQVLNGPTTDPSLTPSVSGGNSSIGNIYNPNLYDGSANIHIPIYPYSSQAGELGVSLSYNTKGVKVDETPSAVGLHWNLDGVGRILRVMKDMPDEIYRPILPGYQEEYPTKGKWRTTSWPDGAFRYSDGEYDDFTVSVGRLNFTFNLSVNGFLFTHPNKNVKVEFTLNGNVVPALPDYNYAAFGFKITDEQGNQYWFTPGDISTQPMYSAELTNPELLFNIQYTSRWVISRIIPANGNPIRYTYKTFSPSGRIYAAFSGMESGSGGHSISGQDIYGYDVATTLSKIDSICYPNNVQVRFVYAPDNYVACFNGSNILRSIEVIGGDNRLRYLMDQAYRISSIPGRPDVPAECPLTTVCNYQGSTQGTYIPDYDLYLRMILKGIDIQSGDGAQTEPYYSFGYNPLQLPKRLSGAQDLFGYYNGNTVTEYDGKLNIPLHIPIGGTAANQYGVIKAPNVTAAQAAILTKVSNAYGGSLSFDYEAHDLATVSLPGMPSSDPLFMGVNASDGLRVRSITEADGFYAGNYKQTLFTYSGGKRFLAGGYFHYPRQANDQTGAVMQYAFNGIYVSPHQMVNGSNHGYSTVTATEKDQDGLQLSRRTTTFTNFTAARYQLNGGSKHYYQWPFTNKQYIRDWELGLPVTVTQYDQNNRIIAQTTNSYNFTLNTTSTLGEIENTHSMRVIADDWLPDGKVYILETDTYRPYTGKALLTRTTSKKFISDNLSVNDTLWYSYDSRDNLDEIKARNSKGQYIITKNVYNYDVSGPGVPFGGQTGTTLYNMTAAGLEYKVSTERWKQGAAIYDNQLLDASITGLSYSNGAVHTRSLLSLSAGSPVGYTDYTGMSQGSPVTNAYGKVLAAYNTSQPVSLFKQISDVELFDAQGNPLQTKLLDQDIYKAMFWDTATGQKLAEASNCRYSDIAYTSFESSLYGSNLSMDHSGAANTSTDPVTGKYVHLLWTAMSPGTAITINGTQNLQAGKEYILSYWVSGTAPTPYIGTNLIPAGLPAYTRGNWKHYILHFTPATAAKIKITGGGPLSFIDEIRLFPADAQMQSWTYEPLFGVSSSTDASGRVTLYEYDKFGRTEVVRDQEKNVLTKMKYILGQ